MTVARAERFRAAAEARYRRTRAFGLAAAPLLLRRWPRPVRIDSRVLIDARLLRSITVAALGPRLAGLRTEMRPAGVIERLVGRGERADARHREHPSLNLVAGALTTGDKHRYDGGPGVSPVTMVLSRPPAAASVPPSPGVAADAGWSSTSAAGMRSPARFAREREDHSPRLNVSELTERVVAAIDRRMHAARERLGG